MEKQKLHILGEILESDSNAVAIVGSRKQSEKGEKTAYEFSYYLATKGITIVSGMAKGIDSVAHRAALEAGGRTIAVLGSGVDVIYPQENESLYREIIKNGAVVSQFPMGTKPFAKNFLARNKIIAELSRAVLVIEGARISGTLSIASWAGKLGREVFAFPGSEITDYLISEGATIANSPMQILEYLNGFDNS
ncbi:MAG: DNA-processing protein DprA [Patescibacteria group bacterium]